MSKTHSKIPRALRTDLRDDGLGQSQFVETRIIQPTAGWSGGSQGQIRFLLPKQGILDKSAYVQFGVKGANANSRLPITCGALAMFETATLFCGGIQVAQTRGVGHLLNMKQFYRTPHDRDNKQAIRVGCFAGQMIDGTETGGTNKPGHYGVDTYADWAFSIGGEPYATDARDITTGYRITDDAGSTPEWRVYLEDLFPLLYNNNLPLGLIEDEFSIVLDLSPDEARGQRSVMSGANNWAAGTEVVSPSLHVDLIFYDDPINQATTMDKLKDVLDKGEQIIFTDHQYILQNQPVAGAAGIQEVNVLLGLDHQIVRNILISTPTATVYNNPNTNGNELLGAYFSVGSSVINADTGKGGNTLQLTINSQPVYPNPLDTDAKIKDQLDQVFPTPFKINAAQSSYTGQTDAAGAVVADQNRFTDKTLMGKDQSQLCGQGHFYGINLSRTYANVLGAGTSVGRQPVLLELTDHRPAGDLVAKLVHIWASCERVMNVVGGKIRISGS